MKPLAILKDSLREAWDSKVLLVLISMSLLFALLLASIGFRPIPAEKVFGSASKDFPRIRFDHGRIPLELPFQRSNVHYTLENFQVIRDASNPAEGEYQFDLLVRSGGGGPLNSAFGPTEPPEDVAEPDVNDPKGGNELEKKKGIDPFAFAVFLWNNDVRSSLKGKRSSDWDSELEKEFHGFSVTEALMEEFIRERFEYHYNVKIKEVRRQPGSLAGPQRFHVVTDRSDPRNWPHTVSLFFGLLSLEKVFPPTAIGQIIYLIQNNLVNGVGANIGIILGVIITSFFIPNMLRKGTIDLLLSKPIHRSTLLVYKYIGGMSFMLIFSLVAVGSVWLVLGLRSGIWAPKILLLIPLLTFTFGVLYAVSVLMGVLTRSAIASLLVTLAFGGFLWVVAVLGNWLDSVRKTPFEDNLPQWVFTVGDSLNAVLPRTRELDVMTTKLLASAMTDHDRAKYDSAQLSDPNWLETFGVSLLWIAVLLGIACWRFSRRDY